MNVENTLLVGYDFSKGKDVGIITVAERKDGVVEIINAFQGTEAWDLYSKLITLNKELE